jgi:hypothetical protein
MLFGVALSVEAEDVCHGNDEGDGVDSSGVVPLRVLLQVPLLRAQPPKQHHGEDGLGRNGVLDAAHLSSVRRLPRVERLRRLSGRRARRHRGLERQESRKQRLQISRGMRLRDENAEVRQCRSAALWNERSRSGNEAPALPQTLGDELPRHRRRVQPRSRETERRQGRQLHETRPGVERRMRHGDLRRYRRRSADGEQVPYRLSHGEKADSGRALRQGEIRGGIGR